MAGFTEYRNEQFIQQYEHISKLDLLTDEELSHVKRKHSSFEISIRSATEIKPFIDYIKYEIALMKKFRQMEYDNEEDGRALDKVIAKHVKDLFRLAIKRFQDKRKLWDHYIAFAKQKFPNAVIHIYREMLNFHHKAEDYIEAAQHEMLKHNFEVAQNFIKQGMANQKESSEKLIVTYIECFVKQGEGQDEEAREATLLQASKFYAKFLKNSEKVTIHCELLKRIQGFDYALSFQNDVLANLMTNFVDRAEVWDTLAKRHLDGFFFELSEENKESEIGKKIPFEVCLCRAIAIYDKSFDSVSESERQKMFSLYIDKLLQLDNMKNVSANNLKIIRQALGRTFDRGYKEDNLLATHFIYFLQLRMFDMRKNQTVVKKMLQKAQELYPSSMISVTMNKSSSTTTDD